MSLFQKIKVGVLKTLGANVINNVIEMFVSMAIVRLLSTNDYGVWSYVLNLYSYPLLISGFGLLSGVLQFGTENSGEGKAFSFFKYGINVGLIINLVLISIYGSTIAAVHLPIFGAKPFILLVLPILLLEYIYALCLNILRSQNRVGEYATSLNVKTVLISVGTCAGALVGLWGLIIGRYVAYFFSIIYVVWTLRSDIKQIVNAEKLNKPDRKLLWHYSIPTGASSAMNCLVYYLDITFIATLIKDADDVGIYKVGTLIPNAIQFIPTSIIISILPIVIKNRGDIKWIRKNMNNVYLGLFVLNVVIVGILFAASPLIIYIISGEKYMASVPVLRVLALGYFFSGTFRSMSVNMLAAFRRVYYGFFISVTSAFFDIVLNYLLINIYGMIGAAYATLMVDIITAVISFGYVIDLNKKGTINKCFL